ATLWVKPDLAHGDVVVEVPMLVVASAARRRGVGRLLVDEVRGVAAAEGATLVELIATSGNATARDFYRSLGFLETDHVSLEFVGDMQDPPDPEE
ncbi:MAG: GNAT family N-acetyltransferase, partial [Actinomycetota bacterium]|nr:GNAT family N-acetyltransferase [Actinomycetota bacterium]